MDKKGTNFGRAILTTRFLLLIAFLFCLSDPILGQKNLKYSKGYIVISRDTLRGFILSDIQRKMHQSCKFQKELSSSLVEYFPSQIKGFFVEKLGYFRSIESFAIAGNEKGDYFFQEIEKGKASLLLLQDEAGKNHYFLEKDSSIKELKKNVITDRDENGAITKRTDYLYRGVLQSSFIDCPQDVSKLSFNESSLKQIIWNYNRCIDPHHNQLTKRQRRFYLGYSFGIMQNDLIMNNLVSLLSIEGGLAYTSLLGYKAEYSFKAVSQGLFLESALGKNKHVSLSGAVLYSKVNFSNTKLEIDYSNLNFLILPKYSFLVRGSIRPFVAAGFIIPMSLMNNTRSQPILTFSDVDLTKPFLDKSGNQVLIEPLQSDHFTVSKLHFSISAGIDFFISQRSKISAQVRMEKIDLSNSSRIELKMSSIVSMLSYSYRFIE